MFWFFGPETCRILAPRPGIEPTSPVWTGKVLTTGPPGTSLKCSGLWFGKQAYDNIACLMLSVDFIETCMCESSIFCCFEFKRRVLVLRIHLSDASTSSPEGGWYWAKSVCRSKRSVLLGYFCDWLVNIRAGWEEGRRAGAAGRWSRVMAGLCWWGVPLWTVFVASALRAGIRSLSGLHSRAYILFVRVYV